jgi:hypothetical protein
MTVGELVRSRRPDAVAPGGLARPNTARSVWHGRREGLQLTDANYPEHFASVRNRPRCSCSPRASPPSWRTSKALTKAVTGIVLTGFKYGSSPGRDVSKESCHGRWSIGRGREFARTGRRGWRPGGRDAVRLPRRVSPCGTSEPAWSGSTPHTGEWRETRTGKTVAPRV